ncbi:MAG: hypothetical protein ABIJ56_13890 [Pseudomonadota bacterium]
MSRALLISVVALAGCFDFGGSPVGLQDAAGDQLPDSEPDRGVDIDVLPDTPLDRDAPGDMDVFEDEDADVGGEPETPECDSSETYCEGDALMRCEAGAWVLDEVCALGCHGGEGRCLALDPSNVDAAYMSYAESVVRVTGAVLIDTGDCDPDVFGDSAPSAFLISTGDGGDLCVMIMASLTVSREGAIEAEGKNPFVLLVDGDVMIRGTVFAGARNVTPGPAGGEGGPANVPSGGACGAGGGSSAMTCDPGGGGGGHGGSGGDSGMGTEHSVPGALGGNPHGSPGLSPLAGGCGGGGGATGDGTGGGAGGAGGGAIQISASGSLTVQSDGLILAPGGGGLSGGMWSGGGGGGAGGGILLEGASVAVHGAVAANGGGGGASDEGSSGSDGGSDATRAPGGDAPVYEGGSRGGSGGAGDDPDGETSPDAKWNTGGGGGAAGRVRINSRGDGVAIHGVVSPLSEVTFTTGEIGTI